MRLVLDTNVVFSALLWQGTAHKFLQAVRTHSAAQLFSSVDLIEELAEVLHRSESMKRLAAGSVSVDAVLADYVTAITLVEPARIAATSIDPDDDVVLATAVAARADLIVSGDRKHLLILQCYESIPIVTVAQALVLIESR